MQTAQSQSDHKTASTCRWN